MILPANLTRSFVFVPAKMVPAVFTIHHVFAQWICIYSQEYYECTAFEIFKFIHFGMCRRVIEKTDKKAMKKPAPIREAGFSIFKSLRVSIYALLPGMYNRISKVEAVTKTVCTLFYVFTYNLCELKHRYLGFSAKYSFKLCIAVNHSPVLLIL